jgi:hypothetical protein
MDKRKFDLIILGVTGVFLLFETVDRMLTAAYLRGYTDAFVTSMVRDHVSRRR